MNRTYRDMPPRWAIRYVDSLLEDRMVLRSDGLTVPLSDTEETLINAWTLGFDVRCYAGLKHAVFVIPPLKALEQTLGFIMLPEFADKAEEGEPDPLVG